MCYKMMLNGSFLVFARVYACGIVTKTEHDISCGNPQVTLNLSHIPRQLYLYFNEMANTHKH